MKLLRFETNSLLKFYGILKGGLQFGFFYSGIKEPLLRSKVNILFFFFCKQALFVSKGIH